jgi:hypothetical protein
VILDNVTSSIATLVKDYLNECGTTIYSYKLVKTTRNWDDPNVPLVDFPVLKVYRLEDSFNTTSYRVVSSILIKYEIVIDKTYKTVPLLNLIGRLIHNCISVKIVNDDVILSNRIVPQGAMQVVDMPNADVKGIYTYTFAIEDTTIPNEIKELLLG